MAKLLKLRRGSTSQHSSFTGAEGEVTVDTTKDTLVVHDGSTAGGHPIAKESDNLSLIDEDNMASNSATRPPSQQSVKAYVDAGDLSLIDEDNMSSNSATRPPSQQSVKAYVDALPDVIDEDNMSSDSATRPPSQQSTKAYVDTTVAAHLLDEDNFASDSATKPPSQQSVKAYIQTVSNADAATYATINNSNLTGTATGVNLTLSGDLTVNGTTTTINSTTLSVDDKNIELGSVSSPSDTTADGGGITLKGASDKTFNWVNSTDAWTSSEHVHLGDNKELKLGDGSDLKIYHDSNNSKVHNTNNGQNLILQSDYMTFRTNQVDENILLAVPNGSVKLYHNGLERIETTSSGIRVLRNGTDAELEIKSTSQDGAPRLTFTSDSGDDNADYWRLRADGGGDSFSIQNYASGSWENNIVCKENGNTELYHDHSKKLETTTAGVTVTGTVTDSKGELRTIPQLSKSSAHTIVSSDAGKHSINSSGGWVFNTSTGFTAGQAITLINNSGSDQTIDFSAVSAYNTADGATGNRTLAARGMATAICTASNTYYISGAGLS